MSKRTSGAEVIAATFGVDLAEMSECRYQPTRFTSPAVYTFGNDYYAAHKTKPRHKVGGEWTPVADQFWAEKAGTIVWTAKA